MALIAAAVRDDPEIARRSYGLDDGLGGTTSIALWNHAGDDTLGLLPRLDRMAATAERLLGGEVYHYHSKLTVKQPRGGGSWRWHQDYGYWYKNGCLFPDLLTAAIAVGPQTEANGCLQLLDGSHRCGRIEHVSYGDQTAADDERVQVLADLLDVVAFEADPGDVVFFHANTLHRSPPNESGEVRELLLCAYNTATNDPVIEHHHPGYHPLGRLDDGELLRRGLVIAGGDRVFQDPSDDRTIEGFTEHTQR